MARNMNIAPSTSMDDVIKCTRVIESMQNAIVIAQSPSMERRSMIQSAAEVCFHSFVEFSVPLDKKNLEEVVHNAALNDVKTLVLLRCPLLLTIVDTVRDITCGNFEFDLQTLDRFSKARSFLPLSADPQHHEIIEAVNGRMHENLRLFLWLDEKTYESAKVMNAINDVVSSCAIVFLPIESEEELDSITGNILGSSMHSETLVDIHRICTRAISSYEDENAIASVHVDQNFLALLDLYKEHKDHSLKRIRDDLASVDEALSMITVISSEMDQQQAECDSIEVEIESTEDTISTLVTSRAQSESDIASYNVEIQCNKQQIQELSRKIMGIESSIQLEKKKTESARFKTQEAIMPPSAEEKAAILNLSQQFQPLHRVLKGFSILFDHKHYDFETAMDCILEPDLKERIQELGEIPNQANRLQQAGRGRGTAWLRCAFATASVTGRHNTASDTTHGGHLHAMTEELFGFVGLGAMGGPIAGNLAKGGVPLTVFDAAGTAERAPAGAASADSVAALAATVDTILLSLPDGKVVTSVAEQIIDAANRRVSTVVDTSTIGIEASENVHKAFADAGIDFVDAPVSGGVSGAVAATISLMFSGEQATLERLRPF